MPVDARRLEASPTEPDATAFTCCDRAFVFFLQRSCENHVGVMSGLGKKSTQP
jgi:hypothetical protein